MTASSFSASLSLESVVSVRGSAEDRQQFVIDGQEPQEVVFPETLAQVSAVLRAANERRLAVVPVGQGAFLHLGGVLRRYDLALSLKRLNRLVDYQPTDMTVTVEAGMTLAQLQQLLGEHGQWLPIDPPLPEQATIGGLIATNLSGPMRLSQGTIRDFLIGLKVVQADGTVIKGGGRVVKNVAGYDLPKLYCGSLGTLGVMVEATFKVRPRPETQVILSLPFPSPERAMALVLPVLGSELQPAFLELANFHPLKGQRSGADGYLLFIGFAGIAEEVSYQQARVRELVECTEAVLEEWSKEDEQPLVEALCNFPVAEEAIFRCKASVLPTQLARFCSDLEEEAALRGLPVRLLARAGNGVVCVQVLHAEGTSSERVLSWVDWLRIMAKKLDGYVVVEAIDPLLKERVDVWGHIGGAFPLMKKLKDTLDPQGILNPGRFVGGI
jgi:glycolate oxidase FAD binding subunit